MKKLTSLLFVIALLPAITGLYAQDAAAEDISSIFEGSLDDTDSPYVFNFTFTNLKMNDDYEHYFKSASLAVINTETKKWSFFDLKASNGRKIKFGNEMFYVIDVEAVITKDPALAPPVLKKKFLIAFPEYVMSVEDEINIMDENKKILFAAMLMLEQ